MHANVVQTPQMPSTFSEQTVGLTAVPVFMRLREYHCMDVEPNRPASPGGIQNAWFRGSTRFQEDTVCIPFGLYNMTSDRAPSNCIDSMVLPSRVRRGRHRTVNTSLGDLTCTTRAGVVGASTVAHRR